MPPVLFRARSPIATRETETNTQPPAPLPDTHTRATRSAEPCYPKDVPNSVSSQLAEENKALRKQVAELRRANEILKAAAIFFGAELDRPGRR